MGFLELFFLQKTADRVNQEVLAGNQNDVLKDIKMLHKTEKSLRLHLGFSINSEQAECSV